MSEAYQIHPWKGFLPKKAILMARPQEATLTPQTDSLDQVTSEVQSCTRCSLCESRKNCVPGEGNSQAQLLFLLEAPQEGEDSQGRPLVDQSGQLFDRMIAAIGLDRSQIYITPIAKCRPPEGRRPLPNELGSCSPFLARQLAIIQPQVIVALGESAAQTLLQTQEPISQIRGQTYSFQNTKVLPTFHPSDLLKHPELKKDAWEDLQKVAQILGLEIPKRK